MFHVPCSMKKGGFTIIELIISIFILSVALVGIFNAFSIITILTSDSVNRLTATYLAQEGMEIVRNIRDINWLNMDSGVPVGATWVDGLNTTTCATTGCQAGYASTSLSPYTAGSYLYLNANGFYGYGSGTKTKFERKITITFLPTGNFASDYIMKIIVQVSWDKKATILNSGVSADTCTEGNNCVKSEETLYNWYYPNH